MGLTAVQDFNLKLCIRDYVGEATHVQILVLIGTVGASPHIGEILPPCDFFDCPVLSFLFSGTRPGRTAEPIFTLCGSNDVFSRKEVPFGGQDDG